MLSRVTLSRVDDVAAVLAAVVDRDTLADVLNCLLSADAEPSLSSYQVDVADRLLESLAALRPDAREAADCKLAPAPAPHHEAR